MAVEKKCDYLVVKYKGHGPQLESMPLFLECLKLNNITTKYHYDWLKENYGNDLEYICGAIKTDKKGGYKIVAKVNKKGEFELL